MPLNACAAGAAAPSVVVLDTNVVLDLLVFADVRAQALAEALGQGRLCWLATAPMLDELADVLSRPFVARWCADAGTVLAQVRTQCRIVEQLPCATVAAPRCADPDDQKFIDLAWHWPAAWLFSRDRAVLDLARAAGSRGLMITTPAAWPGWAEAGRQNAEGAAEAAP